MRTIFVKFYGIELMVEGIYNKPIPETYEQPAEGGNFEIHNVLVCGNNITEIIKHSAMEELTRLINDNIQEYL